MANRLVNALVQKLYFIEEVVISDKHRDYLIMGSTGNVYTVTISDKYKCTCPDHVRRKVQCKHIYFVLVRVLKVNSRFLTVKKYTPTDLASMFSKLSLVDNEIIIPDDKKKKYDNIKNKGSDDDSENSIRKENDDVCPICLDDILDLKLAYYCKNSCGKNIHIECFNMWSRSKGSRCVFCNAEWFKDCTDKKTYINLN